MSRSQLRLAAILLGLVVFVVAVYCASIERVQAEQAQEREAARLVGQARIVGLLLGEVRLHEFETARIDAIVDRAGAELGLRVTVVGADGALLGDSEIGLGRLPRLGSFASRPEIAAALATGEGASLHRSETLGREFLYGAARVRGAVVRVGTSAESLADLAAARRRSYVIGGFAASVVAIAMAWLLSGLAIRPLREMQRVASAVARGRLDDRLPLGEGTELAGIADSINKMAEQLRTRFSEADQEKERLQAVLEGMVEGVLVLDGAGVVLLANQRIRELYEVTGELVGHPFLEVIRDVDLEQTLSAALKGGDAVSRQLTTGALVPRTLQVQAARFPAEGKRLGTVAVFHDVSELARLEEVRRDFVANASHELRTPLAAIRGFAETLLSSPDLSAEAQRSYVEIIERNAVRLGNIVQDLLDLSRLESRGQSIEGVDVAPLPIARRLLREYEQCPEVHRCRRRGGNWHRSARLEGRDLGAGHGNRDPRERAEPDLRALLPGRQGALARTGRDRPGPRHREAHGAEHGRGDPCGEPGRRGLDVHAHPSVRDGCSAGGGGRSVVRCACAPLRRPTTPGNSSPAKPIRCRSSHPVVRSLH
jgi:two-component system phosphate regulon sensor histidine kinase PhoR